MEPLAALRARVLVTIGEDADPAELGPQPANVRVERAARGIARAVDALPPVEDAVGVLQATAARPLRGEARPTAARQVT